MDSRQKSAIVVGISTSFITSFFGSALNLSIPDMSEYFHMGAASVGWIVTVYMLTVVGLSAPFGKIADSTGRRRMLLAGTAVFSAASLITVIAHTVAVLLSLRVMQAIGASMIFSTNMPIAMSAFPGNQRGKVIGKVIAGTYSGLALGPVIGGIINNHFGWQSIFIFGGAVGILAFVIAIKGIPEEEEVTDKLSVDIPGNIIYVFMLSSIVYGLTAFNTFKYAGLFIAAGIILIFVFARVEMKSSNPVIDVRIFANDRTYTLSNLTALFNYSATFALGYLASIYLQVVQGYSSQTAGLILIAQPVFMAVLTPGIGILSDRVAAYKLASAGMLLCALSLLSFALITIDTPTWVLAAALSVAGIGCALFSSPNTNVVMSCVKPSQFGVANSILATMRNTGQAAGMAIVTLVVNAYLGNASLYEASPQELVHTMHIAFSAFAILCAAGIFMSISRKKIK